MRRLLAVVAGLLVLVGVVYLASINPARVDFRYGPAQRLEQVHVVTLLVAAFAAGVLLVTVTLVLHAGWRAVAGWGDARRSRRSERIDGWVAAGRELLWQGDTRRGQALLLRACRARPDDAHTVLALARSYRDTGDIARAHALLARPPAQGHADPEVLLALADLQRLEGDTAGRIETLERLHALYPQAPAGLRALRDAYMDAGRWAAAAAIQQAVLATVTDPRQAAREREALVPLRYAAALAETDPAAQAAALEALADARPAPVPVWVSLGDALLAAGRREEASVLWERALRARPRTVFAERLADMAEEPAHRDRLRTLLQRLRPDQVEADHVALLVARLHLADGEADEAARLLDALGAPPRHAALLHHLWGDIHRRRGALDRAVAAYALVTEAPWAYRCRTCGRQQLPWAATCPQCRGWDTYRSVAEIGRG